jgi:hypothetical protein
MIGAFFIQFGTRLVARFKPHYWTAFKASAAGFLLGIFISVATIGFPNNILINTVIALIALFGIATAYGAIIKSPENTPIGTGKGLLVFLIQLAISIIIVLLVNKFFPLRGA